MRAVILAGLLLALGTGAHADTWSGAWKTINGRCIDGLKVDAKEEPGVLVVTIHGNERFATSERRVTLAADGSGKLGYESQSFGPLQLTVAPGRGRRELKLTQQVKGVCQWRVE